MTQHVTEVADPYGGYKFGDQVATLMGIRGVVVKHLTDQHTRSCNGCPRREGFRAEPERYGLCTGCTPEGDEGRGKGDGLDGPILVAFPYLQSEMMDRTKHYAHKDCLVIGRYYPDELRPYKP